MPRPLSRSGRGQSLSASAGNWRKTSGGAPCAVGVAVGWAVGVTTAVAVRVGDGDGVVGVALAMAAVAVMVGVEGRGVGVLCVLWYGGRVLVGVTVGWPARLHPLVRRKDRHMILVTSLRKIVFSLDEDVRRYYDAGHLPSLTGWTPRTGGREYSRSGLRGCVLWP